MFLNRFMLPALLAAACTPGFAQLNDTLAKAASSGVIAMGVREASAPLSYLVGNSKYAGYHVELCERILGQVLPPNVRIQYQPVTSQNRIPLTQNGTVDIECGSTSNTAARKQQVAFALTTYITEARFAVKAASGIEKAEHLRGKTIVTTTGTTLVQRLRKLERQGLTFNVVYGKDHADSFLLVEGGRADAFAMDDNTLAGNIASAKNPKDFRIVGDPLGVEPIAIMLRKDDPRFKAAVDGEIRKLMASGELEKLYARWFMQPIPPTGAVIGIPFPQTLKAAFQNPNDDAAEAYEKE
jgi:glutamate/aspartate transport system substrate-binding protein